VVSAAGANLMLPIRKAMSEGSSRYRLTPQLTPPRALHAETSGNRQQRNRLI
jgi:hypothetical protein